MIFRSVVAVACVSAIPAFTLAGESLSTHVSAERMAERIEALSRFGANPEGGVSRVAFSEADIAGRE